MYRSQMAICGDPALIPSYEVTEKTEPSSSTQKASEKKVLLENPTSLREDKGLVF